MIAEELYLQLVTDELDRLPSGAKVSYVGQATIYMVKRSDGSWVQEGIDSGIRTVSSAYVAGKYPCYD